MQISADSAQKITATERLALFQGTFVRVVALEIEGKSHLLAVNNLSPRPLNVQGLDKLIESSPLSGRVAQVSFESKIDEDYEQLDPFFETGASFPTSDDLNGKAIVTFRTTLGSGGYKTVSGCLEMERRSYNFTEMPCYLIGKTYAISQPNKKYNHWSTPSGWALEVERSRTIMKLPSHPNIVKISQIMDWTITMSWERGFTGLQLTEMISDLPDWDETIAEGVEQIALNLARGLDFLHSHLIIHQDLKLDNFIVYTSFSRKETTAKIIDMGSILKTESADQLVETPLRNGISRSIEEVVKGRASTKSDIWALGQSIYLLLMNGFFSSVWQLFGENKLTRPALKELALKSVDHLNATLKEKCPEWDHKLEKLLLATWQADPAARPSAKQLTAYMNGCKEGYSWEADLREGVAALPPFLENLENPLPYMENEAGAPKSLAEHIQHVSYRFPGADKTSVQSTQVCLGANER